MKTLFEKEFELGWFARIAEFKDPSNLFWGEWVLTIENQSLGVTAKRIILPQLFTSYKGDSKTYWEYVLNGCGLEAFIVAAAVETLSEFVYESEGK